jgi:hypothetical protein
MRPGERPRLRFCTTFPEATGCIADRSATRNCILRLLARVSRQARGAHDEERNGDDKKEVEKGKRSARLHPQPPHEHREQS